MEWTRTSIYVLSRGVDIGLGNSGGVRADA